AGLAGVVLELLLRHVWLRLAGRERRRSWLPAVSAAIDVSVVRLVLVLLACSYPTATRNSTMVWSCDRLAVLATALPHDVRVTLMAGALALLQSALIWLAVVATADGPLVSAAYGEVSTGTQLQRIVLLIAMTIVTTLIVFRTQRLTRISGTDGLTGLPNRTYLNTRLPHLVARARARGETLSLALIDLDNFRHINA